MAAEISAESKLSRAMLFVVLGSAALFFGAVSAIGYSAQLRSGAQQASPIQALALLVTGALIDFIGASIMYEGFGMLHSMGTVYDLGRYGTVVQLLSAVLIASGFYLMVFSSSGTAGVLGSGFFVAGYLIGAVCASPVGTAFYGIGKRHDSTLVKSGAVLYVLVPLIGPLVLYLGLKSLINKAERP